MSMLFLSQKEDELKPNVGRTLTLLMILPRSAAQSDPSYSGKKTDTFECPRTLPAAAQSQPRRVAEGCGLMVSSQPLRSYPGTQP